MRLFMNCAVSGKPFRILLRCIPGWLVGLIGIHPFMEFAMPVSERKGAQITVIDRRLVNDTAGRRIKLKISIVESLWILVQMHKAIRWTKAGAKISVFVKRLIGCIITESRVVIP